MPLLSRFKIFRDVSVGYNYYTGFPPPRGLTTVHHNYAGELAPILRFKRCGVATGISNRARRRERSAAYSNDISLGFFNHWHYSNPDNCRCSGHRRLPRVYYEYNEPQINRACSLRSERDHLKFRKKSSLWQVSFFSGFQTGPYRYSAPNFSFWNELMDRVFLRFAWWISSARGWKIDGKALCRNLRGLAL